MCLGIPTKVIEKKGEMGIVEFGGVKKEISLQLLEGIEVGDYVILHAGFAIQKLDEAEAKETLSLLNEVAAKSEIY
jgi:hydrogenase expression/formation protein HypC